MRHRKKNLTLAKTLSVHKLNCALQRKSQLIGSFASDKKSPKLCHRESSSRCSYCLRNWHFEFSPGSNTTITSKSLGPFKKKLTQKQQKQKPVHLVSKIEIRNMTSMGEKWSHCNIQQKQQCQTYTTSGQTKPFSSLLESLWSNHLIRSA